MKQVLAAIVALALIGGAYYLRTEVIAPTDNTPAADGQPAGGGGGGLRVACDDLLADACPSGSDRLAASQIVSAFGQRDVAYDALVAPSIVIDMVEGSGRSQVSLVPGEVLARTPMVLVLAPGAAADLGDCLAWTCVQDDVARGVLRPGLSDPSTSTAGIAAYAALAGGYFTETSGSFSLNGFNTGGFIGWLDAIQREALISSSPVENIIRFAGAQNDSAIVTEADALDVVARAAGNAPTVVYPDPLPSLSAVVAVVGDADTGDVADLGEDVGQTLRDAGWRGPDGAPPGDAPALAEDDGLPSGGVMLALQQRVN